MDRVIAVVGPTATGKTALAVMLAARYDGEVISADSMQIYRGMDIGTAKATIEERRGIVHHMLDVVYPEEPFSVGRYVEMADPILQDVLSRGKTAVIAGGTGLYVDALIAGRAYAAEPDAAVRKQLEHEADECGMEDMLEQLRGVDPESAARLHLRDRKRILRALEVYRVTGQTITAHNAATQQIPPRYAAAWIGLDFSDRRQLYERINLRVDEMVRRGLLKEIQTLLDSGIPADATAMQAIGYKEFLPVLAGERSLDEAVELVKQESRRYAKRQRTWFRRRKETFWISRTEETAEEVAEIAAARLKAIHWG